MYKKPSLEENKAFFEATHNSAKRILDRVLELRVECAELELDLTCNYSTTIRKFVSPGKCHAKECIAISKEMEDLNEVKDLCQEKLALPEIKVECVEKTS